MSRFLFELILILFVDGPRRESKTPKGDLTGFSHRDSIHRPNAILSTCIRILLLVSQIFRPFSANIKSVLHTFVSPEFICFYPPILSAGWYILSISFVLDAVSLSRLGATAHCRAAGVKRALHRVLTQ